MAEQSHLYVLHQGRDVQKQQSKQRRGLEAEDLDERAHEDWVNDE
jgi:hypothetical protein